MIEIIEPLPIGNALRIYLAPPNGAKIWRVFRNTVDVFAGWNDPNAALIAQTSSPTVTDADPKTLANPAGLDNGVTYYYHAYYFDGSAWIDDGPSASGVPLPTYADYSVDCLSTIRDRIEAGLAIEVARGALVPGAGGNISVLTAPPIFDQTLFPLVTVHLRMEAPTDRALGEVIEADEMGIDGNFNEYEGWYANTQIDVMGWALNPDVRIALRKALRRIMVANLRILSSLGFQEPEFSQQDAEDLTSYSAPVYQTQGMFKCVAPIAVGNEVGVITDVTVTAVVTE